MLFHAATLPVIANNMLFNQKTVLLGEFLFIYIKLTYNAYNLSLGSVWKMNRIQMICAKINSMVPVYLVNF